MMIIDINLECGNDYKIHIGELAPLSFDKKVAIVTNTTIAPLHLEALKAKITATELIEIILPDGEQYKNYATIELILNALFEARFDRDSVLIAFGGGVVGDMTGFAAAIFQRGIDFIQIPTTLLSQIDSSVGGKTGINNAYGKNLIGSFNQPRAVYIDPAYLNTLPEREFSAGMAELIKMAVAFDKPFFEWLQTNRLSIHNQTTLIEAIAKTVKLKAKVVELDEKEAGERAKLNYGHTYCHVIENETKYEGYLHGEAVAIGIVMANHLALALGKITHEEFNAIKAMLLSYNLPTTYKIADLESFYAKFFLDKKTSNNAIKFIVAEHIGHSSIVKNIPKSTVMEALNAFNQTC